MRLTFALRVILPAVTMALATGSAGAREARRTEGLDNRPDAATRGAVRRTSGGKNVLAKNQLEYLARLMRDTFAFIDYACDPTTGIPTNYQDRGGHTNSTPVGLYIASLAVASRLGLLPDADARQRFEHERHLQSPPSISAVDALPPERVLASPKSDTDCHEGIGPGVSKYGCHAKDSRLWQIHSTH